MPTRLAVWILSVLLVCLCSGRARAAAQSDPSSAPLTALEQLSLTPWQPSESYDHQEQSDPRLDRPVHLWRAGVPLRELFSELAGQTGVSLDFWPAGTDDARVCVTLYLNPEQPPSLRAVMAQLSWVTGCIFASADGPVERRIYYLLGTSIGEGVAEKLTAQRDAQMQQFQSDWESRRKDEGKTAASGLEDSRKALALSRNEAIARYRGTNDALLLNLLDPPRRAALGVLTELREADLDELLHGQFGMIRREWTAWPADQQAALKQALGLEQKWPTEGTVYVLVGTGLGGTLTAVVQDGQMPRMLGTLIGLLASGSAAPDQELALRRQLGETIAPQEEEALRKQQQEAWEAAGASWRKQRLQQAEQAARAARALSPARQSLLLSIPVSAEGAGNALWQIQEAAAKGTGLNVISDCFWLPSGRFSRWFPGPRDAGSRPANVLDALSAACSGAGGSPGLDFGGGQGEDLGLEWGDSGAFLAFRSKNPGVWRAAMLPADVQATLDSWLEPHLGSPGDRLQANRAPLAGNLEKLSWLAGRLNDIQVWLGGAVICDNPLDPTASRQQELRQTTLQQVGMALPFLRLMATFTPEQWAQVKGQGLRWGYDLTPAQQSSIMLPVFPGAVPEGKRDNVLLRIGKSEAQAFDLPDGTKRVISPAPTLDFLLDGKWISQIPFMSPW